MLPIGLVAFTAAVLQACLAFGKYEQNLASGNHWIDAWAAMPLHTEVANLPNPPFNQNGLVFSNSTIRQTIQMSIGAEQIRIRISNNFGITNLHITAVTIARPVNGAVGSRAVRTNTLQTVTFGGSTSFVVPNGALVVSDPLNFMVHPQEIITISMYLAQGQGSDGITSHPGSHVTIWMSNGNFVNEANLTDPLVQSIQHWFFLSAVEAWVPSSASTFAIVGDSITDGSGSDANKNDRWPDLVRARMLNNPTTANIAIVNQAASGNRILIDGTGPNALGRIDRDVLAHSGVKFAMIFEGVNDIGSTDVTQAAQDELFNHLILAYKQIITRVHAFQIPIFAGTITPFSAPANLTTLSYANLTTLSYSNPVREATRQKINTWIRTSGMFDAVMDFDAAIRDPNKPSQLAPQFNSGDYLHPNEAGYQAIANSFPIDVFAKFPNGVSGFT